MSSEGEFRADRTPLVAAGAIEWHQADLTATIGGEVAWNALRDCPAGIPLWLPADCDGCETTTIAQLVERNSTGPLRIGYGAWRDLLLGCQFRNSRGELISAGGRTVKNVAGYDLTKFMIGQHGIFGNVVTVTTRLHRRPADACVARFKPDVNLLYRLLASPCRPHWATLNQAELTCGYHGEQRTIDFYLDQLPKWEAMQVERTGFDADQKWRSRHWKAAGDGEWTMRASVPPTTIGEFAKSAALNEWIAEPAFGIVLGKVSDRSSVRAAAERAGGRAWFYSDGKLDFAPTAPEKVILERLKQTMDSEAALASLPW